MTINKDTTLQLGLVISLLVFAYFLGSDRQTTLARITRLEDAVLRMDELLTQSHQRELEFALVINKFAEAVEKWKTSQ